MSDRSIASRPSLQQVLAIVDFMEKHPLLALGQLRGLEGREESKKLWFQLTRIVNNISGPTRSMKSWIKYWADKKSTVRCKVESLGGDPNSLSSNIEKKIYDLFLTPDNNSKHRSSPVKQESPIPDNLIFEDSEGASSFEGPLGAEERQLAIMEKLLKAMSDQASALAQMAQASQANSQAMQRLAESAHIQARALDRVSSTFETVATATQDVRVALVDIDTSMKRYYSASPS